MYALASQTWKGPQILSLMRLSITLRAILNIEVNLTGTFECVLYKCTLCARFHI